MKKRFKEKPKRLSQETKDKISKTLTGVKHTKERRKNISEAGKGRILSEQTKMNISKAVSGEKNGFYNKTHTDEVKRKLSELKKTYYDEKGRKPKKEIKREKSAGEKNPMFGQGHKLSGEKHPRFTLWLIDGIEYSTQEALNITGLSKHKLKSRYSSRRPNAHKYGENFK